MTDGSILGDLFDERSPRHSAAVSLFLYGFDQLPDLQAPPPQSTERQFFNGDVCKVRGELWVWNGVEWRRFEEARNETHVVEVK
jgi:hypothetical protein